MAQRVLSALWSEGLTGELQSKADGAHVRWSAPARG
jgi:hypothetical protein